MADTDDLMEPLLTSMRQAADHRKDGDGHTLRENLIKAAVAVWQQRSDEQITASPTEHCTALIDALLPRIHDHVAEVWEAYEGWRDKGQDAFRALLTIWQALEPDRKNMTFGDDPQCVVDETLRALNAEAAAERVRQLHMSSEVDDIVTPDEDRAGKLYRCLGCNEVAPCSTIRALDAEGSDDS